MKKNVLPIDDSNFESTVLASDQPFLLELTAPWCGPCKALAPVVEALADEQVGVVKVGALDIDSAPATAARLGVRGAPTILVFKGGREVARQVGVVSRARLLALLQD